MSENTLCFQLGRPLDPEQVDSNDAWQNTLETLESELQEAGVSGSQCRAAACFLYSAFLHRLPLLLAGVSGNDVADALCASLFGSTAACIDASTPYDKEALTEAEDSSAQVIVVQNVLAGNWLTPLVQFIPKSQKYFVFLHPFMEELTIEPKSLYNYMHPVITDAFIDTLPNASFVGGVMVQPYKEYPLTQKAGRNTVLSKLHLAGFAATRLQAVLNDAEKMLRNDSADMPFLYGYFPYAYVTGQTEKFLEIVSSENNLSKDLQRFFNDALEQG